MIAAGGAVVWFTGLPQCGKSTLAARLRDRLAPARRCILLDGDELRATLGATGYAAADRDAFYRALGALAALLAHQGHLVLVAATAPRREHRAEARRRAPRFIEVWLRTDLADCERRDRKGLYARARRGEAPALPGIGAEYEPPAAADVIADGGRDDRALDAITALIGEAAV